MPAAAPRVIVHDLVQAEAALRGAAGRPIVLESPSWGARSLGALYWREMIALARARVPAARCETILDCGDQPGLALHALRHGIEAVRLAATPDILARVADIAGQLGRRVDGEASDPALDLAGERDPEAAVAALLAARAA